MEWVKPQSGQSNRHRTPFDAKSVHPHRSDISQPVVAAIPPGYPALPAQGCSFLFKVPGATSELYQSRCVSPANPLVTGQKDLGAAANS